MNKKHPITIGYLTSQDPTRKRSWSGIHYFMSRELEGRFEKIIFLSPVKIPIGIKRFLFILNKLHILISGKKFNGQHNTLLSRYYAREFNDRIKNRGIDILIAPAASTEIAYLKTKIPIIYISDTSFDQIKDYYDTYSNFSDLSNKISNKIEQRAILNSTTLIYSSNWAAEHVKNNYRIAPREIHVIPFGANIDAAPSRENIIKEYTGTLNLLFLGKQWERKGGALVLEATRMLHKAGYKVHLAICGCIPSIEINEKYITVHKFLDKSKKSENDIFLKLMYESHLLFLPTKADCTPIVFCEAAAFGLPVLSRDTGGVSSIVQNKVNGILLSESAQALDYYKTLVSLIGSPNHLVEMSNAARDLYEIKFNWTSWGDKVENIILDIKAK